MASQAVPGAARTLRPGDAGGPDPPGCALLALSALGSGDARRTILALGARQTLQASGALLAGLPDHAALTRRAARSLLAWRPCRALGPLLTGQTGGAGRADEALGALLASRSSRSLNACGTLLTGRPVGPLVAPLADRPG